MLALLRSNLFCARRTPLPELHQSIFGGTGVVQSIVCPVLLLVMLVHSGYAQTPVWQAQQSGSSAYLYGTHFISQYIGTAVGDNGVILRTVNGGMNWFVQTCPVTNHLKSVCFTSPDAGVIVGANGVILRTVNGGGTWATVASPTTINLFKVRFVDAATGFAVGGGGTVLKTTDGGTSWSVQASGTTANLKGIAFTDASNGCITGSSVVIRTTNGGGTWVPQVTTLGTNYWYLDAVRFTDPGTAIAVGGEIAGSSLAGMVARSTDGGSTWTRIAVPSGGQLFALDFADVNDGMAVGYNGRILRTTDGGANWSADVIGTGTTLGDVDFISATAACAVGSNGVIQRWALPPASTTGLAWSVVPSGTQEYLYGVSFPDQDFGAVAGNAGTIRVSDNQGLRWTGKAPGVSVQLSDVQFVDRSVGFATGQAGTILRTGDGGETWQQLTSHQTGPLYALHFLDGNTGWVVGHNGVILHTTDGGQSWIQQSSSATGILESVFFTDALHGMIVGDSKILRTVDGGGTWVDRTSPISGWHLLNDVKFSDSYLGTIVGQTMGGGVILRTSDGGDSWFTQVGSGIPFLYAVQFVDGTTGFAAGYHGALLKTTDGGNSWTTQSSPTNLTISSLAMADINHGWAVGDGGTLLRWGAPVPLPGVPVLTAPDDGASGILLTPQFTWRRESSANGYIVQVATDPDFSSVVIDTIVTDTLMVPARQLAPGTTYFWRVAAQNITGIGQTAQRRQFATHTLPMGNCFITTALWEGQRWYQNQSMGSWFPVVDSVAHFGINNLSWGQVRTKAEIPVGQILTITAQVHLNSNNGSANIARISFGDGWSLYEGQSFGLKFSEGNIFVHKMTPTESNVETIGTYTPGETITFSLLRNASGTITLSAKGVTRTYVNPASIGTFRAIIAVSDANPDMFLVSSVDISLAPDINAVASVVHGWNMASVPVFSSQHSSDSLFPGQTGTAFRYDTETSNYVPILGTDPIFPGPGFWVKYGSDTTFAMTGIRVDSISVAAAQAGWVLMGSVTDTVQGSALSSDPSGSITGTLFAWDAAGQTYVPDPHSIIPGSAYWVKVTQPCTLRVQKPGTIPKAAATASVMSTWAHVEVRDALERSTRLYLADSVEDPGRWQMPPYPPDGVFNVRFGSNTLVAKRSGEIVVHSASYPLTIVAHTGTGRAIRVEDVTLTDGRSCQIGGEVARFRVSLEGNAGGAAAEHPQSYSLHQNYPNPFNPSTVIRYDLPERAHVTLQVYNTLGQVVATLVKGDLDAGYHEVRFDGAHLASGIYFCRMQAGSFTQARKLILMR